MNRWDHWRQGRRDFTPTWLLCLAGFALGVAVMGLGELLLVAS